MKEIIIKHKKIVIAILIVLLLLILFWDNLPFGNSNNDAEKSAITFVEHMLDGDAKKCTELMCDDFIDMAGYESTKLFTNAFQKNLDTLIETYEDKYGKSWDYKVSVIDSFEYTPEYYEYEGDGELMKVVLKIEHEGGGLFKDKKGTDEIPLIMQYSDGEWLVYDFPL